MTNFRYHVLFFHFFLVLSFHVYAMEQTHFQFVNLYKPDRFGLIYAPLGWDLICSVRYFPEHSCLITLDRKGSDILHNLKFVTQ